MADHAKSEGARYERKAVREYLRRQIKKSAAHSVGWPDALNEALQWILKRQERYEKKAGGLGRK